MLLKEAHYHRDTAASTIDLKTTLAGQAPKPKLSTPTDLAYIETC